MPTCRTFSMNSSSCVSRLSSGGDMIQIKITKSIFRKFDGFVSMRLRRFPFDAVETNNNFIDDLTATNCDVCAAKVSTQAKLMSTLVRLCGKCQTLADRRFEVRVACVFWCHLHLVAGSQANFENFN